MSDPQGKLERIIRTTLTRRGDILAGEFSSTGKAKDVKPQRLSRTEWDDALTEHVAGMNDGDSVDVEVSIRPSENGKRTARLIGVASLTQVGRDTKRSEALQTGGFVNPYTFVPTLPRTGLDGTGMDDATPPSHAYHGDGQLSGTLTLTLTTVTPLLLPVPAAEQPKNGSRTFDVRVDPGGRPLIHGASFKGALRSAYETITASRYGVFFEHHDRLAYRVPANAALNLTPARVHQSGDDIYFRLCQGDADWNRLSEEKNEVQYAAWVPAYQCQHVRRFGRLADGQLTDHHGSEVHARVVLYQYERDNIRFKVWRATHLASAEAEITEPSEPDQDLSGRLTRVPDVGPRLVRGWLSATGHSIKSKHDERLFIETPHLDVPLTEEHKRYWNSVLRAYDLAQGYNDPNATYSRQSSGGRNSVVRSRHVPSTPELRTLPPGTLVYVKYDAVSNEISEVHPVMIGRLPFEAAPADLLHESLRPARRRDQLSPADRLFGWVPSGRPDNDDSANDGASGYRGRLRVRSITCLTDDWRPPDFPPDGVTLAPLSSPKPTQFRFYASPDSTGTPMSQGAKKADGYAGGGGLRGRKIYRWRMEEPGYWQPRGDREDLNRSYLALSGNRDHPKQLVRHRSWVRPEVTFRVELFLDGVAEAELGALLWLLGHGDAAPLRLGAGKPYGFGVVSAELDAGRTRLWDAAGVRTGWLRLTRPDPVGTDRLTWLAANFESTARGNGVLREATESYRAAAGPVTDPVHYPRLTPEPQAESYQWFVENERLNPNGRGWSLPHVRDGEQRLPYLGNETASGGGRSGRGADKPQDRSRSTPASKQERRSGPEHGANRSASAGKGRRGHRPS